MNASYNKNIFRILLDSWQRTLHNIILFEHCRRSPVMSLLRRSKKKKKLLFDFFSGNYSETVPSLFFPHLGRMGSHVHYYCKGPGRMTGCVAFWSPWSCAFARYHVFQVQRSSIIGLYFDFRHHMSGICDIWLMCSVWALQILMQSIINL